MKLTKEQAERRVFEILAPLIIEVTPDSIQQDKPPAPDIKCHVVGRGIVNYELVALDDEFTRTRLSNMYGTKEAWERALQIQSSAVRAKIVAEFFDVFLSVHFEETVGPRGRVNAFVAIQRDLVSRQSGFTGEPFDDYDLPKGLRRVVVHRGQVKNGPLINAPSAGFWSPPQVEKIKEKLCNKRYVLSGPLELFAYATHDEPNGSINSLDQIKACVSTYLSSSQFQAVHIFHFGFGKHIASYSKE